MKLFSLICILKAKSKAKGIARNSIPTNGEVSEEIVICPYIPCCPGQVINLHRFYFNINNYSDQITTLLMTLNHLAVIKEHIGPIHESV